MKKFSEWLNETNHPELIQMFGNAFNGMQKDMFPLFQQLSTLYPQSPQVDKLFEQFDAFMQTFQNVFKNINTTKSASDKTSLLD